MKWWVFIIVGGVLLAGALMSLRQRSIADMEVPTTSRQLDADPNSGDQPHPADGVEQSELESTPSDEVILAEEKQKRIWDNEHATFELETYFGKALQKAIRQRDPDAIKDFFKDETTVALIPLSGDHDERAATVSETRTETPQPPTSRCRMSPGWPVI